MPISTAIGRLNRGLSGAFLKRQFFRNVAVVLTGAAMAQVITVAFSPAISRLFSPSAFGALGTFMALLSLIGPTATLAYSAAVVIPKREDEATALVWLSLIVSVAISIASFAVVIAFKHLQNDPALGSVEDLLYLVPFAVLFEGLFQTAQQWMIREKRYRQTAQINIFQALISGVTKVVAGLLIPTSFSLVLVSLLAVPINAILFVVALNFPRSVARWPGKISVPSIRAMASRFADFPLYRAPQSLVNAMAQSIPLLALAYSYSSSIVGFYTLTNSVLGAPTQLLTKTVNDVFFPRLVDASHRGEPMRDLIIKATGALGAVSALPLALLAVAGPTLFGIVFGAKWFEAGEYARWLSLLTFTTLVLRPALSAVPILQMQGAYLVFEIASTILKLASLALTAFLNFEPTSTIAIFALVGSITNVAFFYQIMLRSQQHDSLARPGNIDPAD